MILSGQETHTATMEHLSLGAISVLCTLSHPLLYAHVCTCTGSTGLDLEMKPPLSPLASLPQSQQGLSH